MLVDDCKAVLQNALQEKNCKAKLDCKTQIKSFFSTDQKFEIRRARWLMAFHFSPFLSFPNNFLSLTLKNLAEEFLTLSL